MEGAIRREADMPDSFHWALPWLLFFGLTIGISQLVFIYNFISTIIRKPSSKELEQYRILHQHPSGMGITKGV
jgi:hypothetical protein